MYRLFVWVLMVTGMSACYSYARVPSETVAEGGQVELTLSSRGVVTVEPLLGAGVEGIQGTVLSNAADSLRVFARGVKRRGGDWTAVAVPVTLGAESFSDVRQRQLDKRKSALAAVGAIGAVALLATADLLGFGSEHDSPTPSPTPDPGVD